MKEGGTTNGGGSWTDTARWEYSYNGRGEVSSGMKLTAASPPAWMGGDSYAFDAIGNRLATASVGYTANALNQYSLVENPSAALVFGEADAAKNVRVNGEVAARGGRYFFGTVAGDGNGDPALPQWPQVTVQEGEDGQQPTESHGRVYLPPASEQMSHDPDGNLTRDGRWAHTWDAENRLVAMETRWTTAQVPGLPQLRLEFAYDSLSRRVSKTVKERAGGNPWQTLRTLRFAYEGWNLIAESEPLNSQPTTLNTLRTYQWGTDLSRMT